MKVTERNNYILDTLPTEYTPTSIYAYDISCASNITPVSQSLKPGRLTKRIREAVSNKSLFSYRS